MEAPTVQAEVEAALTKLGWRGRSILAAGRTDSGVHASGQVIAFDLEWKHDLTDLCGALNALLPEDISLLDVRMASSRFHPRFDALSRRYVYRIACQEVPDPMRVRYSWHLWPALKIAALHEIAGKFVGEHDFSGFGKPMKPGESPIRRVIRSSWSVQSDELCYEIEANAFLFRMVRRIVKAQVEVAAGRKPQELIDNFLARNIPGMFQGLAPPQGLTLVSVSYPDVSE